MPRSARSLALACLAASCGMGVSTLAFASDEGPAPEPQQAKSVIFFVADGMGVSMISTADALLTQKEGEDLPLFRMPVTGFLRTWSSTGPVTDSAAGATAFATGSRCLNNMVSWSTDGKPLRSVLQDAHERGMATGVMTSTDMTDATPAAFSSNAPARQLQAQIFEQMIDRGIDVLSGGLRTASIQADPEISKKGDHTLSPLLVEMAESKGYTVIGGHDVDSLETLPDTPTLLVPAERGGKDVFGPEMAKMTSLALDKLSKDEDGFFLVVECEETDSGGHANDLDRIIRGVHEINGALQVALDFQKEHPDTLVILTADHDTGGLALSSGDYKGGTYETKWVSGSHTAQWVPIFASGPGSQMVTGVHENTDVNKIFRKALGFEPLTASAD